MPTLVSQLCVFKQVLLQAYQGSDPETAKETISETLSAKNTSLYSKQQ